MLIYLITGPHSNILGCFRCSRSYISEDLNIGQLEIDNAVGNLSDYGMIYNDNDWFYLPGYFDDVVINKKTKKVATDVFKKIPPSCMYRDHIEERVEEKFNS